MQNIPTISTAVHLKVEANRSQPFGKSLFKHADAPSRNGYVMLRSWEGSVFLPKWLIYSIHTTFSFLSQVWCPTCWHCLIAWGVIRGTNVWVGFSARGKPCIIGNNESHSPERWHSNSGLLAYLLDVNARPGKHIHKLRVLPALLIAMAETKISIVSPGVHFCWVWSEQNTVTNVTKTWMQNLRSTWRFEEVK